MDKKKIVDLQADLEVTRKSIEQTDRVNDRKLEVELGAMKKQAIEQSSYTAAMGSVLGSMLWKTSKTEDVINTLIHEVS